MEGKKVVIKDLFRPSIKNNTDPVPSDQYEKVSITYSENGKNPTPEILKKGLAEEWENLRGNQDSIEISQSEFQRKCVLPYINGLWLTGSDYEGLLRTNSDIVNEARNTVVNLPVEEKDGHSVYPVYYPGEQKNIPALLRKWAGDKADYINPKPLPVDENGNKPKCEFHKPPYYGTELLFLPNPYVVPGGDFNEMYGWDSYFVVEGVLNSAKYIINNPGSPIFIDNKYRASTPQDAANLFQLAKGMVDDHAYMISCYGGNVLNGNRVYFVTRSQPPFFTKEALAVYDFYCEFKDFSDECGNKLFKYTETLYDYLGPEGSGTIDKKPSSFDEWLEFEIIPASIAYYDFWTDSDHIFAGWSPYNSKVKGKNPRAVEIDGLFGYRYLTDGIGPDPTVLNNVSAETAMAYYGGQQDIIDGKIANPNNVFYNPNDSSLKLSVEGRPDLYLTQNYYSSVRNQSACGYDLSGRFGLRGQFANLYSSILLTTLVYQMKVDIDKMAAVTGYILPESIIPAEKVKEFIETHMWDDSHKCYADRLVDNFYDDKNQKLFPDLDTFCYPFSSAFSTLWSSIPESGKAEEMIKALTGFIPKKIKENNKEFMSVYGVPTSLTRDTNNQWDYPYSWAPNVAFTFFGLLNYGKTEEAANTGQSWINTIDMMFSETGAIFEKYTCYNPTFDQKISGWYNKIMKGFGWTNAVYMQAYNNDCLKK